ncbi:TonB-dependent receptor plug domain-containing protein [Xylophilus ampelinus]|uniref:TonB-dependent receptor-like protein n=1 Tax=Xylophilus ampelinus TaxID=54067 RepID=A0A318SGN6_9BURK|nr:TonB-dependent receptor plug domain-containing protein [Xylophilus ampelinus]MCS4510387.1 hypothetical protein [Xylophilus ampelinus]PYE77994.1 hypothetical protein DFQ15_11018 [Xylophilus ampelinus]
MHSTPLNLQLFALAPGPCLSCAAGIATAAHAQSAPDAALAAVVVSDTAPRADGLLDLDAPSDTGSGVRLTPRETPAAVMVVDRVPIDARGAQDTRKILRAIPRVTVRHVPGRIGVHYRGFNGGAIGRMFTGIYLLSSIAAVTVYDIVRNTADIVSRQAF